MPRKPMLLAAMLSGCLLAACSTDTAGIADSSCRSFKPISSSKQDTEPTRRQIVGHNRAYDAICQPKGAPAKVASNG